MRAKFGIRSLFISTVLINNVYMPDGIKKKLFDTKIAQTTVLVEFTKSWVPELDEQPSTPRGTTLPTIDDLAVSKQDSFSAEAAFVFIRKFESVSNFMEKVRSLDTVLENIESFSSEVRRINKSGIGENTPSGSNDLRLPNYSPETNLIYHEKVDYLDTEESPMGSEMVEMI